MTVSIKQYLEMTSKKVEVSIEDTTVNDTEIEFTNEKVEVSVEELQSLYFQKYNKEVPVNKKNNLEWIYSKLA
jgi:hypothetical protein